MRYLEVNLACRGNDKPFDLGYEGENIVTGVIFDYSSWRELYGVGALTLAVQPSGNSNPYPVTLTAIDDTHALWTLTKTDLNEEGAGRCQLTYVVGEAIKKSAVFVYKAGYSMDATGEIPDPYISYFEQILETGAQVQADAAAAAQAKADAETAAQDARASADEIENMTATAETLPAGSDATAEYSDGTLSLGIPQGAPGDEGPQGPPGPTGNGIQSTVLNADYTLTITFTDGTTYTTEPIRGPQGPQGVPGPTGNGIQSTVLNSDYTLTITFTDDTTYTTPSIRGEQGEQGDPGVVQDVTVNGTSVLDGAVAKVVIPEITKTVTGNPITIDDADGEVKSLNVELLPIQDLHGYDKPWAAGNGVNKLIQGETQTFTSNGVTWTANADGSVTARGTAVGNSTFTYINSYMGYTFNGNYKFAFFPSISATIMAAGIYVDKWKSVYPNTITSLDDLHAQISQLWFQVKDGQTADVTFYPMIYSASETAPTSWTPYENECPISPHTSVSVVDTDGTNTQTVTVPLNDLYGGTVDVIGGQDGKSTMAMADLGAFNWEYDSTYSRFQAYPSLGQKAPANNDTVANIICSVYKTVTDNQTSGANYDKSIGMSVAGRIDTRDTDYTDAALFKQAMAGVQLCYELATPTPITTTPTSLTLYKGDNVISSDGDMTLNYERNLQAVITSIEDKLSALEG